MNAPPPPPRLTGSHSLMQLTLPTEDLGASRGPEKRLSKRATARMVDSLPSPVSSASSKDYASAKRRGFSAPSLKRSVTAVTRMTDRLTSIPSLSRSTSNDAQVAQASAAGAGVPSLQRAKTESAGGTSVSGPIAMVSVHATKAAVTQGPTRTALFGPLTRSEKAKSAGEQTALPYYEPEEKLCPLDSPLNAAEMPRSGFELEETATANEPKPKRLFATGIPSLVRKSSKDSGSSLPPMAELQPQVLPPTVPIAVSPPTLASQDASGSPKDPTAKGTPKRSKRKFAMPSLRRSSTNSSEKSGSSTVVPDSGAGVLTNSNAAAGSSSEESTMESPLEADDDDAKDDAQESEAASSKPQMFGIPSLLRSLTGSNASKRRTSEEKSDNEQSNDSAFPSPTQKPSVDATTATQMPPPPSLTPPSSSSKLRKSMLPPVPSSTKAAARFFSGIRRSVSTTKGSDKPASTMAKAPLITEDDFSDTNADDEDEDEEEKEKEMRSLLHILQVPRGRRGSTQPLMSTGQEEIAI